MLLGFWKNITKKHTDIPGPEEVTGSTYCNAVTSSGMLPIKTTKKLEYINANLSVTPKISTASIYLTKVSLTLVLLNHIKFTKFSPTVWETAGNQDITDTFWFMHNSNTKKFFICKQSFLQYEIHYIKPIVHLKHHKQTLHSCFQLSLFSTIC